MPAEITMPQLSDTMTEGTVVKWLKKEGDKVRANEEIAEVETDKATMPMESFEAGTIAAVIAGEGAKVKVGEVMAVIATGKEDPAAVKKQYAGGGAAAATAATATTGAKGGTAPARPTRQPPAPPAGLPERKQAPALAATATPGGRPGTTPAPHSGSAHTLEDASRGEIHEPDDVGHGDRGGPVPPHQESDVPHAPPAGTRGNGDGRGERIFASPLARRIAADKGVDLAQVEGSGPGGRIVQKDVLEFAERAPLAAPQARDVGSAKPQAGGAAAAPAPLPQRVARGQKEVIPLSKIRAVVAQRLQQSKQQVPHFYETIDVDAEALSQLRERLNKQLEPQKVRLSVSDFVNKGIAAALLQHPALNAHFNGKTNEITRFGDVNLGIAVALPDGLIVPVLRHIDQMGLREIRQRSVELADKARAGRLKQDELSGATFTVSTLGMYGIRDFGAIINPPEVAILAVGAAEPRAVVRGGQVVARTTMSLTLSVDHRAVDGATAAEFMRTLKAVLEEPGLMLA